MASPGCRRGQRGPRCSIHARRNLPDKAFGSLLLLSDLIFLETNRGEFANCKLPYIAIGVGLYLNRFTKTISGIKSLRILVDAVFFLVHRTRKFVTAHLAFPADYLQSMAFSGFQNFF